MIAVIVITAEEKCERGHLAAVVSSAIAEEANHLTRSKGFLFLFGRQKEKELVVDTVN